MTLKCKEIGTVRSRSFASLMELERGRSATRQKRCTGRKGFRISPIMLSGEARPNRHTLYLARYLDVYVERLKLLTQGEGELKEYQST